MFPFTHKKEVVHISETIVIIEGYPYKRHDNEEKELKIIATLSKIIEQLISSGKQKPILALTTFINNKPFIMSDILLTIGSTVGANGVFTLLDNKTLSVIPATFSNQAVGANSNPEFATFALGTDPNTVVATVIAAGSGTVVFTAHGDYTDPGDGSAQSNDFTVTKNFTVSANPDGVTFDVTFS